MNLGAFSLSLNVKDIKASKEFYEKLGFESPGGDIFLSLPGTGYRNRGSHRPSPLQES